MKRVAAVAIMVGCLALTAYGQRGGGSRGGSFGSHGGGGFSGFRGGSSSFSMPHSGGFSAPRSGFPGMSPRQPFSGGVNRFPGVPRSGLGTLPYRSQPGAAPYRYAPGSASYGNHIARPGAPGVSGSRMPYQPHTPYTALNRPRAPYHSPNGGVNSNWYHYGGYHGGWYNGWNHYHVGFYFWAGVPLWYGWGYPYLPAYMYYPGFYGDSYYDDSAAQPYYNPSAGPYNPPPDPTEPEPPPAYTPWPESSPTPAPSSEPPSSAAVNLTAPVTLVFKDGRPPEKIHNYLLTATTLSVLDQGRREIPVDQIDLPATAATNRKAGVDFALPGASR